MCDFEFISLHLKHTFVAKIFVFDKILQLLCLKNNIKLKWHKLKVKVGMT